MTYVEFSQLEWVIRHVDAIEEPWTILASGPVTEYQYGNLSEGYWEVLPRIAHGTTFTALQQLSSPLKNSGG